MALLSAGLLAVWPTACGLTADYSGLQGGTRPEPDASAPSPDATAGPGDDAGEAGPFADGSLTDADASRGFCAALSTPVKLCTDFDEGQAFDAGWGATDLYGGEAISLGPPAFSAPAGFQSAINPGGAPSSARLLQAVPTDSPHVHVEFEMLLTPSDGTFELGVIHEVTADGTTYGLYFREVGSALQVELRSLAGDGSLFDKSWPLAALPASWTRIDLDMDIADSGSFVVQQDGVVTFTQTNVPTSTPSRTALFVEIGFYSFTPASGQASFDNAIVDWP